MTFTLNIQGGFKLSREGMRPRKGFGNQDSGFGIFNGIVYPEAWYPKPDARGHKAAPGS